MLVTNMYDVNYIPLFWAYNLLYLVSKYQLVCRIRSIVLNNTRLEWDSDLIIAKWNKFLYIQTKGGLSYNELSWLMLIIYSHPDKGSIINIFNINSQL